MAQCNDDKSLGEKLREINELGVLEGRLNSSKFRKMNELNQMARHGWKSREKNYVKTTTY